MPKNPACPHCGKGTNVKAIYYEEWIKTEHKKPSGQWRYDRQEVPLPNLWYCPECNKYYLKGFVDKETFINFWLHDWPLPIVVPPEK